jgi:glyoxylase-like metal-dependent hydrolase (beta-lactamase superfamily II)
MDVLRIDDGLWRWGTHYGEWKEDVGCVYVETEDAIVLIDPLVPEEPDEAERFWKALDRDVKRARLPVHVLVTVFWHARSSAAFVQRYEARLHAPSGARAAIDRRTHAITDVYRAGDLLPGGIVSFATARRGEVVFWLPGHRALVPGDVILGAEAGGVRLCPESWLPAGMSHEKLRASLRPLLELPVERVLVSHGVPVLQNGHAALAALDG